MNNRKSKIGTYKVNNTSKTKSITPSKSTNKYNNIAYKKNDNISQTSSKSKDKNNRTKPNSPYSTYKFATSNNSLKCIHKPNNNTLNK